MEKIERRGQKTYWKNNANNNNNNNNNNNASELPQGVEENRCSGTGITESPKEDGSKKVHTNRCYIKIRKVRKF